MADSDDDAPRQVHLGHVDLLLVAVAPCDGDRGGKRRASSASTGANGAAAARPGPPDPPAPPLYLERGPSGKTVLSTEDGSLILADPAPPPPTDGGGDARRAGLTPLQAVGRVALSSTHLAAEGTLERWEDAPGGARVRLDLYLPALCYEAGPDRAPWPPSPAAAALWGWLRDPVSRRAPGEAATAALLPSGTPAPAPPSLAAVLDGLPPRPPDPPRRAGGVAVGAGGGGDAPASLLSLPPELLRLVASLLPDAASLAAWGATCTALRDASDAVPGLALTLFPHQRAAVRWMAEREREQTEEGAEADPVARHPCWRPLPWRDAKGGPPRHHPPPLWACLVTGALAPDPPPHAAGARGGLLCDEPGLGKTITALALILRTRGAVPRPPAGAAVARSACGRGWTYEEAVDEGEEGGRGGGQAAAGGPALAPPSSVTRRPGAPPRRRAALAAAAAGPAGRRANAEDAALVRARAAVASAAVATAAAASRKRCAGPPGAGLLPATPGATTRTTRTIRTLWVQCDACAAWRSLPPGTPVPSPGAAWVCGDHPDPGRASCAAPPEEEEEEEGGGEEEVTAPRTPAGQGEPPALAAAAAPDPEAEAYRAAEPAGGAPPPGWVAVGEGATNTITPTPTSSPPHVAHFAALLASDPALADWPSVAWWVAGLGPESLSSPHGARLPREHRAPGGGRWARFLEAVGLEPAPDPPRGAASASPSPSPSKKKVRRGGGAAPPPQSPPPPPRGLDALWSRVRAPAPLAAGGLTPDAASLRAALLAGGRAATRTLCLSPATLLVVPPALEAHWVDQVARHVTPPGTLRVRVLSSVGGGSGSGSGSGRG